jgi:hypothetical protein
MINNAVQIIRLAVRPIQCALVTRCRNNLDDRKLKSHRAALATRALKLGGRVIGWIKFSDATTSHPVNVYRRSPERRVNRRLAQIQAATQSAEEIKSAKRICA